MKKRLQDENLNLPGGSKPSIPTDSCGVYWDNITMCLRPNYQVVKLYRNGSFEWCSGEWHDFWRCMDSKVAKGEDKVKILKEIRQREEKPVTSFVWDFREKGEGGGWPGYQEYHKPSEGSEGSSSQPSPVGN